MISLIIPATSQNQNYTDFTVSKIRELYPNKHEVEIVVEINDSVTLGINYNNAVSKAKGEIVVLLHNDMTLHPGFIETIQKHITRKMILTYHRVEPPIFTDLYPGKSILDCGSDINSYDESKFFNYPIDDTLINGGSQLFFAVYKEDYLNIDGYTFQKFCEDDDIHLRYKLAGYTFKVANGAMVYHFVSKTSRNDNYQEIEQKSNLAFIKKWGFRKSIFNKVYKKKFILTVPDNNLEQVLDPWFNRGEDIIVTIDPNNFTNYDFSLIQQLNDIISDNGSLGKFQLGNLQVEINSINEYQNDLIKF